MTAPISNGPTTTRLHHYAGHYSTPNIRQDEAIPEIRRTAATGTHSGQAKRAARPGGAPSNTAKRKAYSPRNALIAGISRTAWTRPAR